MDTSDKAEVLKVLDAAAALARRSGRRREALIDVCLKYNLSAAAMREILEVAGENL